MKLNETPERFNKAVTKLYNAFHNGTLNAMKCKHCAVGNIVGHGEWCGLGGTIDEKRRVKPISEQVCIDDYPKGNGYSAQEYKKVEQMFLSCWVGEEPDGYNQSLQFKGLCAVVEYLCELDGIEGFGDFTKLFETENNEPKYELV